METKFTKGEWHSIGTEIRDYTGLIIGFAYSHLPINMSKEEQNANAKLMAAAPALLKALSLLYESLPDGYVSEHLPTVRRAIKKATE